jgi:extradiol dioxygenase family protein
VNPFHLAIPVHDIELARTFYGETLGCARGRSSEKWTDFNFYGHQLVCHEVEDRSELSHNPVDGDQVPVPHFGVVLTMQKWRDLRDRLQGQDIEFVIEPHIRFEGQVGEQATMFFLDPSGNALEFKAFADIEGELFKT